MLWKRCTLVALVLGSALLAAQTAQARIRRADPQPASITTAETVMPASACCPKPCIKYRHRGPKLCCTCEPGKEVVLLVKDPCTCCEVEVPVCLPACCEGEPTVCNGKGFLCRDTVEYEWCCGFYVRVAFKKCGDLVVTTWGR